MILAELNNWQGSRTALLEKKNDAIYLYSLPNDYPNSQNRELKSLWVANSKKRLLSRSTIKGDLDKGKSPYLPNKFCNSNGYITNYADETLWKLQWGLEQNSIAVWFDNQIVAIMPEWSGFKGFYGYSIGTDNETPVVWPLLSNNAQLEKFILEKEFLKNWTETTWNVYQEKLLGLYEKHFQGKSKYYSADGGNWPPLGIHYSTIDNLHCLCTVGLSQLPMPSLEMHYKDEVIEEYRHIELAIIVENITDIELLLKYLSAQAKYPWYFGTHLDNGHTIPCAQLTDVGSEMSFMALVENASFLPKLTIPKSTEANTRMLFMVPIYEKEQMYAEKNTTSELISLLERADHPLDIKREIIV